MPGENDLKALFKPYDDSLKYHVSDKWGHGFHGNICERDISLMFFLNREVIEDIDLTLAGKQLERHSDGYYPIGRCATILNMKVIYDDGDFLKSLQKKLSCYPAHLRTRLISNHRAKVNDREDFTRAVERKDVLFYHYVLDAAMDNFLQTIFAANYVYFPSRKKTVDYIEKFTLKPKHCKERLLSVVRLGGSPETLSESYELWNALYCDLLKLI